MTTEGLSAEKRETVVNAFMEKGGLQCGFCTPWNFDEGLAPF
ncbi:MAG: 2Fe-2S iron-sulfur cluster-binding protein [bacterium]